MSYRVLLLMMDLFRLCAEEGTSAGGEHVVELFDVPLSAAAAAAAAAAGHQREQCDVIQRPTDGDADAAAASGARRRPSTDDAETSELVRDPQRSHRRYRPRS